MNKAIHYFTCLILFFFCFSAHSQSSIWKTVQNNQINQDKTIKTEILYFEFSHDLFSEKTRKAPDRFKTSTSQSVITLPKLDGGFETFQVFEATNFHKELSDKYPTIHSYVARSLNSNKTARISYEPSYGFYANIYQANKPTLFIKPEDKQNNIYKLYSRADLEEEFSNFECSTIQKSQADFKSNTELSSRNADDSNLRQYRAAVSTTGEYAQFFLDGTEVDDTERITKVLAAINVSLDRINGIFERDFSVTMVLVANNDEVIYLNPATDPYNGPSNQILQNTLDNNIGDANYDVGHLFAYEGAIYGNAGCIACVCTSGSKGSGFTVHSAPDSDHFNMIASHEFGHQFGGWHVQSSSLCRSANGLNEVEPGSGSTIMGYAGICSPNVQSAPDDYFNYVNIRDIAEWTINDSSCAQVIPIVNLPPTADAGADYTIPISTAFILEGAASDPDISDALSYTWEQNDPENPFSSSTPSPTRFNGPMFRSRLPVDVPYRYMPQISDIVSGNLSPTWEVLPSVTRDLTFEFTVRDNALGGGQTASDEIIVSVDANFGPFSVTSQSTPESWNVGESETITWDVANTTNAPISATNVDILLSIDGGFTYPYNIATTANDGSESLLIPNVPSTSTARVMVRASNNIFFAINSADIEIQASEFLMNFDEADLSVCKPNDAVYDFTYNTFLEFDEVTTFSTENLPAGLTASFNPSTATTDGTPVQLTISNTSDLALGSYDFNVKGTSASAEKTSSLILNVYDNTLIEPSLINPSDNETGVSIAETLEWQDDINAENFEIEIALDNTFSNLVDTAVVTNNSYVVENLNYDTTYFWRVSSINECLTSEYSNIYSFTTVCLPPSNLSVNSVLQNTVNVLWQENGSSTSWEIEYGETGFAQGSGTIVQVPTNPFTLTGLNSSTEYDIYLRSNCSASNVSEWIGPVSFTTAADFCSGDNFYDSGGPDGNYSNNEDEVTTIYPTEGFNSVTAIFNSFNLESCCDFLRIYDGVDTNAPLLGSFNGSVNPGSFTSSNPDGALTFYFTSDFSVTGSGWDVSIICESISCPNPSDLNVSNVSLSSAEISWDAGGTETQWQIEYGLAGFAQGTGTVIQTSDNPYILTGLDLSTAYDVYLRANCGANPGEDDSGWSEPVSFSTLGLSSPINLVAQINQENGEVTLNWGESNSIVGEWILYYDFTCTETYSNIPIVFYDDFTFNHPTINESGTWELVENQITWTYDENGFQYYGTFEGNYMSGTNDGDGCWYADLVSTDDDSYTMDFTVPEVLSHGEQATNPGEVDTYTFSENHTDLEPVAYQDFLNYNVYRDDELLGTTEETNFTDMLSAYGTYDYHVTAQYNEGESNPSNIATVVYQGVPDISVNPTALFETLPEGGTSTQVLTISNSGDGDLDFNISSTIIDGFGYGEPVVTTIADDATYVLENSLTNETYSPGFSKRTRSYAVSSVDNILVLEDNATNFYAYEQALINLNLPYTFVTDWNTFYDELTGGTDWDMVILNSYSGGGNTFTYSAIDDYVNSGGLLMFAHWNLGSFSSHPLLSNMGVDFVANVFDPLSIIPVSSSQIIFNTPNTIPDLEPTDNQFNIDGQIVDVLSNAEQLAYFGGNPSSGAIVLNQNGTSIYNGFQSENFQADANANGKNDITELIENEVNYLLGANWLSANPTSGTVASGSSVDINITFDATNLTAGIYNATIDIASNDPDDALIAVPVELTVLQPSCPEPSNFTASNVTSQTVDLSWTPGDTESLWEIEYGLEGFTQGTGTSIFITDNPYTLSGIDSNTEYDIYLRAVCGANPGDDDSIWTGPVSFTTPVDYCSGDNFYDSGGPDENYSNNEDEITTIYPSEGFNSVTAIFNSFNLESCCDFLRIYDGVDINAPLLGSFNGSVNPGSFTSSNPDGALTFYFTSDFSVTGSGWDVSIICETITCPNPSNLNLNNISADTAELSWSSNGIESQWEVEYGLTGFSQGTGTVVQTSTNPYVITGLDSTTVYDAYLRANCGANPGDDDSNWIGPISFETSCDTVLAPFSENFSTFILPDCWQQYGSEPWNFNTFADYTASTAGDHTPSGNTNYAWIDGSTPSGPGQISNLKTVAIDVSQLTEPALQFSIFSDNLDDGTYNTLDVVVHNGANETETVLNLQGSTGGWLTYTYLLNDITANSNIIEIEFIIEENSPGNAHFNDILIDDIFVDNYEVLGTSNYTFEELIVYPNPVKNELYVEYIETIDRIELYSLLGQKLLEVEPNQTTYKLNTSDLASATYMLRVVSGESSKIIKLIKF